MAWVFAAGFFALEAIKMKIKMIIKIMCYIMGSGLTSGLKVVIGVEGFQQLFQPLDYQVK